MSIVNIWVERDVALVGVDTEGVDESTGARVTTNKLFSVVQANAVVCGRGSWAFIAPMAMIAGQGDFDQAAERMRKLFRQVFDSTSAMLKQAMARELPARQEINLVGYSKARGRMVGLAFVQETLEGGMVEGDAHRTTAPWAEDMPEKNRQPSTRSDMIWLARAQARYLRERAPDQAGGGHLIVAELTRERMTIAPACEL